MIDTTTTEGKIAVMQAHAGGAEIENLAIFLGDKARTDELIDEAIRKILQDRP